MPFAGAEYRRSVGLLTNVQPLSSDCTSAGPPSTHWTFFAQTFGTRFWACILSKMQGSQLHCSLRDVVSYVPSSSAGVISSGGKVPHGFGLSAAPESVSALYEAWKGNALTRSILRDCSSAGLDSSFEWRGLARDAVLLFSLLSPGCKFLESPRFPGTIVASGCSSSRVSSAPVSALPVPGKGVSASLPHSSRSLPSGGSSTLSPGSASHNPQFPFQRVLRVTLVCRRFHVVQHFWTLSSVFHWLRHLDLRARRRRGSFHWSLRDELDILTVTSIASGPWQAGRG